MNELYISSIRFLDEPVLYDQYCALLSKQRKEEVDRLHGDDDKKRSAAAELLILKALNDRGYRTSDLVYEYGPYGKPSLRDYPYFFFSVSHSKDYAILAVSDKPIGCDIEMIRKYDLKIAQRFFSEEEYKKLLDCTEQEERKKLFFRYWTMKESYIKFTGEGLHCPLSSFTIEKDENDNMVIYQEKLKLFLSEIDILGEYCISICSPDKEFEIKIVEF